jgi:threonine/homoserine/homoserine lactone efflux protein
MCLTPGPNVVLVTACAVNFGFRSTVPQILGITLGFGVMILAAGLGLAGLLQAAPQLHDWFKYAGIAYLLYLAWRIAGANAAGSKAGRARPINFVEAVLITWLNPKGWVTTLGALAAYTTATGNVLAQTSIVAVVLAIVCGISVTIWAAFGTAISRLLATPRLRKIFNRSMAALLIGSLLPVFFQFLTPPGFRPPSPAGKA